MATIGSVTKREDGRYEGELKTLSVKADIVILPLHDKSAPTQPDYRVLSVSVPSRLRAWWIARAGRIVWLSVLTHVGKDGKTHGGRDHLDGGAAAELAA